MFGHERHGVLADVIVGRSLVRAGGQQRRLSQQLGLQRQQVAKNAGQGDDDVDARAAQHLEWQQGCATQPAVAVEPRPRTHQPQRLGNRPALGLQVVGAPQHDRHRLRHRTRIGQVPGQQPVGLARPVLHGERARQAERVEPMQVAARRQHRRRTQQIAAGRRAREAAIECMQDRRQLVVMRQQGVQPRALHRLMHLCGVQHFGALALVWRLPDHMQAVRDQGVFQLQQRGV